MDGIPRHLAEKAAMKTKGMEVNTDTDGDLVFRNEIGDSLIGFIYKDSDSGHDVLNTFLIDSMRVADIWRRFFINLIEMTGIPNVTGRSD